MNGDIEQQIFESINKANRVLIALPQNGGGDALGAGLALFDFLKKLDKQPEVVCSGNDLAPFRFLPKVGEIKKELDSFQSFVVSLKTANAQLDELSYEVKPDRVDIFLKPKSGKFAADDLTFGSAKFPYDLIITLDCPSLEHLGNIYEKNTDLFFETPIINIDHHPANEHYGQINLVDLTATSTSEILTVLIENFEEGLIDEGIATALLTGIIVETNSFQHAKTTPKAFLKASALVSRGARQQDIIKELYKTKNISMLKLWGRALARLREVPEMGLTYSLVNHNDFVKSGATEQEVFGVMKELVGSLSGRKIILFLAETLPSQVVGYFHLHPSLKAQVVASALGGQMLNGSLGTVRAPVGTELLPFEQDVLNKLQKIRDQIVV
ncbi:MAG: DHH family phosphoesterase [Candidatus Doudnabacteria bacterium]|nr:DHH family phosphoesterase [bacterium]MDZ4243945.1 DHH family phosphoesterase [Candidatus Doudnabacteria bacterium]